MPNTCLQRDVSHRLQASSRCLCAGTIPCLCVEEMCLHIAKFRCHQWSAGPQVCNCIYFA